MKMARTRGLLGFLTRVFKEILIFGVSYGIFICVGYMVLEFPLGKLLHEVVDVIFDITMTVAPIFLYILPTAIAYSVKHPKRDLILAMNIFLGLIPEVWFLLLIWSFSGSGNHRYPNNRFG